MRVLDAGVLDWPVAGNYWPVVANYWPVVANDLLAAATALCHPMATMQLLMDTLAV